MDFNKLKLGQDSEKLHLFRSLILYILKSVVNVNMLDKLFGLTFNGEFNSSYKLTIIKKL